MEPHALRQPRPARAAGASSTPSSAGPIADGVPGAAEALRRRIRPFVLRRRKAEVAPELPPRTEATLKVTLDERERGVYDAVRAATQSELLAALGAAGGKLDVMKALEALLRLRQAACHPALLPGQQAATSSKVEALLEALETAAADGHKALVFSQWTSLLDLHRARARATPASPFTRLDGSTRDRGAVVDAFQAEGGPPVMLVSLKAGGTGLNLTAADHVFLCDPWWNPAVEDQAADRAHRIGQERPGDDLPAGGRRHGGGAHPRAASAQAGGRRCRVGRCGGGRIRTNPRGPTCPPGLIGAS